MTGQKELYDIFELIYPVGIIIELATNANPKDLFGIGEWEQIKDRFILAAGDNTTAGNTGGSETTTLSTANMPAHTHTRGTMDITGQFKLGWSDSTGGGIIVAANTQSGAFSSLHSGTAFFYNDPMTSDGTQHHNFIKFQASNAWTGATSSVGSGTAFSNMPPYYVAYLWRRVS